MVAARTRTLGELTSDVQYLADVQASSTRHTDTHIARLINESWQKLRVLVSDNGHQAYLKASSGNLTAGVTSPYSFGTLTLPADMVSLYAFDVTVATNDIRTVDVVPFSERNEWRSYFNPNTGIPACCHIFNIGTESTTTVTAGTLAIHPAPQQAYAYTLWYLPSWVDIAVGNTTYVFNGVAGWEEYVVQDCVCKIAERDNDMAQTYAIAAAARQKAETAILTACNRIQRIGPSSRIDAARRQRTNKRAEFWEAAVMPEVNVIFQHGVNEGVDPKLLPDGWLSRGENIRFRKDGRVGSRFGYDFVSGSKGQAIAGGSYGPSHSVYFKERTGTTTPAKWFDHRADGNYTSAVAATSVGTVGVPRRLPSARNLAYDCVASDVATAGGYLFEAYCDTNFTGSVWETGTVYVNIAEALSHRTIAQYTLGTGGNCKAVAMGTLVLVFWADSGGADIKFAIWDSSALSAPSTGTCVTAFTARANRFDVAPLNGTTCLLCYQSSATNLKWGTVGNTGSFTSKQDQTTANSIRPSITLGATTGNVAMCWAEGAGFLTGNLNYLVSTTAGAAVTAKTTIDSSGNVCGFPVAGPNATADYAFAWNLQTAGSGLEPACVVYNGGGATATIGYLYASSKPFTGPTSSCLMWAVDHCVATDTQGLATYKLLDVGAVTALSGIGNVVCEAVACQTQAQPGAQLNISPGTIENRRFCVSLTSVLTAPSSTAFGCLLPVYSSAASSVFQRPANFGADLVRIDSSPWADRLLPARINGQLIFSGPRVREFDGTVLVESGMEAPEGVTLTQTGSSGLAAGTYQYVVTREWVDHGGRKHRSPPSDPVTTVLASAKSVIVKASGPSFTDRNMVNRVWRTTDGGTIFYLADASNTAAPVATSGTLITVDTDSSTDATIVLNEVLYTQGARGGLSGLLPNDEPPPCRFIWAGNNRLILGGLEVAEEVAWSKLVFPGEPVQYSVDTGFRARIDAEVTGVACLDGTWFVGSANSIFAFDGIGPDDNGGGGAFGDPRKLPADIGFYSQRSIVEIPQGLLFQGRSDRIYLLPRGGNAPQWVGQAVRDTLTSYPFIADVELLPDSNVVVFSCLNSAGTDGVLLVYDTRINEWTVDKPFNGAAVTNRVFHVLNQYGGKLVLDGQITETSLYADDETGSQNRAIVEVVATGDMRPFGPLGHGRMRKIVLLSEYRSATSFTIEESLDGGVTYQTAASYTPSNSAGDTVKVSYDLPIVRGEAYRFRITSTPTSPGEGFVFNSLTAEVYPSTGTPRLADAYRG